MVQRLPCLASRLLAASAFCGALAGCYLSVGFDSDPDPDLLEITQQPKSTTVTAGQAASFVVGVTGSGVITFQWQRNGVAILGANGSAYTTPATVFADDGTLFTVRACNELGCLSSSPALLTVLRGQ